MRILKTLPLVILGALTLTACGLKGPLYLPSDSTAGRPANQQKTSTDKTDQDKTDDDQDDQDDDG